MNKIRLWLLLAVSCFLLLEVPSYASNAESSTEAVRIENQEGDVWENQIAGNNHLIQAEQEESDIWQAQIEGNNQTVETEQQTVQEQEADTQEKLPVEDVFLESQEITLQAGESYQINFAMKEKGSGISYTSSNSQIATVTPQGIITGVSGGAYGSDTTKIAIKWTSMDASYSVYQDYFVRVENTISLQQQELVFYTNSKNKTYQLQAIANPAGIIQWDSSNEYVATVDEKGMLRVKNSGWTNITASVNGVLDSCYVMVKESYLELQSQATVYVNYTTALDYNMEPEEKITWKSSNPKVATVNAQGVVKGKKKGTAVITANMNGIKKKCKITVETPGISLSQTNLTLFSKSTYQMNAYATPSSASIKWKSSNPKVVKVSRNGIITTKKAGKAKITASIPGASVSCQITVTKNTFQLNCTKRTFTKGDEFQLFVKDMGNISAVQYSLLDYTGAVKLTTKNNICNVQAYEKGVERIQVSFGVYQDNVYVRYSGICTIKVEDCGISKQQFSIAKGVSQKLKVVYTGEEKIAAVSWKSSSPKIISVSKEGTVKGLKSGSAKISAQVTFQNGGKKTYTSQVKVSDPKLADNNLVIAKEGTISIPVKGLNQYSQIKIKSSKQSVVSVREDGTLRALKSGSAKLTITADGKKLSCKIKVTDPYLENGYSRSVIGSQCKIPLIGLEPESKVTYESSNGSVAVVDGMGNVTVTGGGRAWILINADGKKLEYLVEAASQRAVSACENGYAIISVSTYSQAQRMSQGYYDCSSLVFRSYGKDVGLLGGTSSWAPTAAAMAQHMRDTGKVIAWEPISVEQLRPGDLIFYGHENNGRYLGIYHVSMYYGNHRRLESPLDYYYERSNIVMVARPMP